MNRTLRADQAFRTPSVLLIGLLLLGACLSWAFLGRTTLYDGSRISPAEFIWRAAGERSESR